MAEIPRLIRLDQKPATGALDIATLNQQRPSLTKPLMRRPIAIFERTSHQKHASSAA